MRTQTIDIYDYDDMVALEEMSPKEASDILEGAYRGYINKYIFPREGEEFTSDDYFTYRMQCAFRVAYRVLEGEQE